MEKRVNLFAFLIVLISINFISAINLEVTTQPVSNTIIEELNNPAVFDLTIKNLEEGDSFKIYSLIGINISPETVFINSEETKKITIQAVPQPALIGKKGFSTYEYKIKNSKNEVQEETITINIINLKNAIEISSSEINTKSEKIIISVKNKISLNFPELNIKLSSAFFENQQTISLDSLETKKIKIPIDKEKIKTLVAGQYILNIEIKTQEQTVKKESLIRFTQQEDIEQSDIKKGFIIRKQEYIRKNTGNIPKTIKITAEKNLLSYLFTTINIEPTETKITGFKRQFIWEKELLPDEELKITIKTNWFFPIIIIILIIIIIFFIKKSIEADLSLRKKVTFVKTRGGQFALKITLRLKAKKFIENINLVDKLPHLVKLYEKYGAIPPDKIDLHNRRIEWNIRALSKDEERIFTYIIYSKIGVVGRFELPSARATYEKQGKLKSMTSNRSFYINEPKKY